MLNIICVLNLSNKSDKIEKALDEADFEAKNSTKRLTRKDVFVKIRSKVKASVN